MFVYETKNGSYVKDNFYAAINKCQQYYGRLPSIHNKAELDFMRLSMGGEDKWTGALFDRMRNDAPRFWR